MTQSSSSVGYVLTILALLSLPLLACLVVMLAEPGIKQAFIWESVKMAALLITGGVVISVVSHLVWSRKGGS